MLSLSKLNELLDKAVTASANSRNCYVSEYTTRQRFADLTSRDDVRDAFAIFIESIEREIKQRESLEQARRACASLLPRTTVYGGRKVIGTIDVNITHRVDS